MTLQEKMIGKHPDRGIFFDWLTFEDTDCTENKRHRHLSENDNDKDDIHQEITRWLIKHHLSDGKKARLNRKKGILEKYKFAEYAKTIEIFPEKDETKKGNFGEIILTEYLSGISGIEILVYKLHYNQNIDQSLKGDDVLLISLLGGDIYLGESKFRKQTTKKTIDDISKNIGDSLKLPLSLDFVANCLFEKGMQAEAERIEELQDQLIKNNPNNSNLKNVMAIA